MPPSLIASRLKHLPRAWVGPFLTLLEQRNLLRMLVRRDFVAQTSGTVLGGIWMLLQPTLQILAFWFLLDVILRVRFPSHVPFLSYFLTGMLPWLMMSGVLQRNIGVLREFSALYQRSAFPLAVLPLVPICVLGLTYGTAYLLIVFFLEGIGAVIPAMLIVMVLLTWLLPLSYLFAIVGIFIRDLQHLLPFVITMTMYLTPILYMPTMIPEPYRWLFAFNPFADLMACIHGILQGLPVSPGNFLRPMLLWLLLMGPTWILFRRSEPHVREAL